MNMPITSTGSKSASINLPNKVSAIPIPDMSKAYEDKDDEALIKEYLFWNELYESTGDNWIISSIAKVASILRERGYHLSNAPDNFFVKGETQSIDKRTQEVIEFNEKYAKNNTYYKKALKEIENSEDFTQKQIESKEILNQAVYTGNYCLPFDLALSTSNFSQGFWGDYSHAGTGSNRLGAVDIATGKVSGLVLYSMLDGTVTGVNEGSIQKTSVLSVINGEEYTLEYLHLVENSSSHLEVGDKVLMGTQIGVVGGSTGYAIHLDLRVIKDGINLDPLRFFDLEKRVRISEY